MTLRSLVRLSLLTAAVMSRGATRLARARTTRGDNGATLVEYAFLIALIAIVCIAAVSVFGRSTGSNLSRSGGSLFTP